MNILFICSQNKRRSLTAERMFDGVNGHSVRSAGTESNARIKVTAGMIKWADIIFCFEKKHLRRIRERFSDELCGKDTITLNIPDEYGYMDDELQDILESCVGEYI
ncbi:MAG: protein tyrosine phosphatase [Oscillospiraceae bacterium]|nr:protein tyrosine phosphatase [Oscillospiraceae bacterium]